MKLNIISYILSLGLHVGKSSGNFNYLVSDYLYGVSSKLVVFKPLKQVSSITTTYYFFKEASKKGSHFLFYPSSVFLYDYSLRLAFGNLTASSSNIVMLDSKWYPGFSHSMNNLFLSIISLAYNRTIKYSPSLAWPDLLIKLIFYIYRTRLLGISWDYYRRRISKIFKLFLFYRNFKNFYKYPDIFFCWNSLNVKHPIDEMSRIKAVVASTVSSQSTTYNITYPMYLNASSMLGAVLFFKLAINAIVY